jgi:WD40 repeat protein
LKMVGMLAASTLLFASCRVGHPQAPEVAGPSWAIVGRYCEVTVGSGDPATATISVRVNWSDGDSLDWSAWLPGGACWAVSHKWADTGLFGVTAQVQSSGGDVSDWSTPHPVRVLPAPGYPFRIIDTIVPAGYIRDVDLSPDGHFLCVAESSSVEVFSTDDGNLVASLLLSVREVAWSPDGRCLYAADVGIIRKVRTGDFAVADSVIVAADRAPSDIVVLPDGSRVFCLYTTSSVDATLLCLDADPLASGSSLSLQGVWSIAVSTDGSYVFVPCYLDGYCYVIETASNTVETRIGIGPDPSDVVVDPRGRCIYLSDLSLGELYVIDASSLRRVRTAQMGDPAMAAALAACPSGDFLYVAEDEYGTPDRVRVYSTATFVPIDMASLLPELLTWQMLVSPDGLKAFMVGPGRRIHVLGF